MDLILAAHGTRRPGGVAMIGDLAGRVSALLDRPVQVAFVDVLGPTPSEVLSRTAAGGRPAVVVPAFLSRGYHVRTDLPAHVAASGHPDVIVTPALGPSGEIARIVADQLRKCGWRLGDSVVLAAAGTTDVRARADLHLAATMPAAWWSPHTCWRTASFRNGCGPAARTWSANRWAPIPGWRG